MKAIKEKEASPIVVDKQLDKYHNVVLFPEKVEKAKEMLRTVGLPKDVIYEK